MNTAHHEAVADLSDDQLFKASELARGDLYRGLRAPPGQFSARELDEMRRAVRAYDSILTDRLRAALEALN